MTEWTDKPPTEPGWYFNRWCKPRGGYYQNHIADLRAPFSLRRIQQRENREWWPERIQEPPHE